MREASIFESMPIVVGARDFTLDRNRRKRFAFPLHNHDDYSEFLLIVEGEGHFQIDGKKYRGGCGQLLCYNRSVWHEEMSVSEEFHAMYIGYKGLKIRNLPDDFFLDRDKLPVIDLQEHFIPMKQLFYETIMEFKSASPESFAAANQWLGVLMCSLSRLVHYEKTDKRKMNPAQNAVMLAKRYIEENYHTPIDLQTLARLTHFTPYHFSHLFKKETGFSPIQHLIQYRIEVSKQYLATTEKSMGEIAELVGYRSETYYHNLFKKVTGKSPGQYRLESRQ